MFTASPYNEAVFAHVTRALTSGPKQNLVVSAVPGSGKTETLVQTCRRLPPRTKAEVVVFGKRNATDLKDRLPRGIAFGRTLHSAGNGTWYNLLGSAAGALGDVTASKAKRIALWLTEKGDLDKFRQPIGKVTMLMNHGRAAGIVPDGTPGMTGLVPDEDATWLGLMDYHGITTEYPVELVDGARRLLRESIAWAGRVIDFVDQLYMPTLTDGVRFASAPVIMVDELQDLDPLQRRMVTLMAANSLFVGVGDPRQAIFGWRGAAADSMDRVIAELRCAQLSLPVCYRCPTSHLAIARMYAPEIQARPGAPEGLVETPASVSAGDFRPGDVVLCRQKAPGVRLAYYLIKRGVPARVLGRDLGEGLAGFVEACRCTSIEALLTKVERRTASALSRAKLSGDDAVALEALDRRETILAVADACETDNVSELLQRIADLFADDAGQHVVTVSTIHKFKGGEADRVWWLDPQLCDEDRVCQEWQRQEIRNLRFVALTRSRLELRMIESRALR